jgi:hypothetical protein
VYSLTLAMAISKAKKNGCGNVLVNKPAAGESVMSSSSIVAVEDVRPGSMFRIYGHEYLRINARLSRMPWYIDKSRLEGYAVSVVDGVLVELPAGTLVDVSPKEESPQDVLAQSSPVICEVAAADAISTDEAAQSQDGDCEVDGKNEPHTTDVPGTPADAAGSATDEVGSP